MGGNGNQGSGGTSNASQAVAILGAPAAISIVDEIWGFTLNTTKTLVAEMDATISKVISSAPTISRMAELGLRTGLWGIALQGILPGKIAKDDPQYTAHIVNSLPLSRVTTTTAQQISTMTEAPVSVQIQDTVTSTDQSITAVTAPGRILTTPVVKAKPTALANVFTAKIHPDLPDVRITLSSSSAVSTTAQPSISKPKSTAASEATVSPGGNTVDAIVDFGSSAHQPVYVSLTRVLTPAQIAEAQKEVLRRQAQWDARHPVVVAERQVTVAAAAQVQAQNNAADATNKKKQTQAVVNNANSLVQQRQSELATAQADVKTWEAKEVQLYKLGMAGLPASTGPGRAYKQTLDTLASKRLVAGSKQNDLNSANSALASANNANNAAQSALNVAIESRNKAENDKANADRNRDKVKADNKDRPKERELIIDAKIRGQMPGRGWTDKDIDDVVAKGPAGVAVDQRRPNKTDDKLGRNDPASAYGGPGKYVVVNDRTGEVTQISDKNDAGWMDDNRIVWGSK